MNSLENNAIVVAGGTGNVGSFIVKELLKRKATVVVPSRSDRSIDRLHNSLTNHLDNMLIGGLHTVKGNIGDPSSSGPLANKIRNQIGEPDAAIASLGRFQPAPSMIDASADTFREVLDDYLMAHFVTAQTFLKLFREHERGHYVFVNGPLALNSPEGMAAGLVSTVTAGQQMMFKGMAQELNDSPVTVTELINYAYIRDQTTQPSSILPGEATGAYASYLVSGKADDKHGESVKLKSTEQLAEANVKLDLGDT